MDLRAERYGYTPGPGMGVAGIWVERTPALARLQADVIAAAAPFMAATAGIDAFTAGHGNPAFDAALVDYVARYADHATGVRFDPHVSTGMAPTDYLDAMVAERFAPFSFRPAGAAVYQVGPFGTAARLVKRWGMAGRAGDPGLAARPSGRSWISWRGSPRRATLISCPCRIGSRFSTTTERCGPSIPCRCKPVSWSTASGRWHRRTRAGTTSSLSRRCSRAIWRPSKAWAWTGWRSW
jgi:hypothetical protein